MFSLLVSFASLTIIICTFYYNGIIFNYAYAKGEDENGHKKIIVIIPRGSANPRSRYYKARTKTMVSSKADISTHK